MRGGSQALLVRDVDGNAYVAKCAGNPQGTRTLINEWIVTRLLKMLGVCTPDVRPLRFEAGIPGEDLLHFHVGNRRIPISDGVHLGSVCPVDPARKAIFDFLPTHLLPKVVNLPHFILAYVLDKWVSQTDRRQAIFVREPSADKAARLRAYLIDHGLSFGGSGWEFSDAPLHGLYFDKSIYSGANMEADCHAAVDLIEKFPEDRLLSASRDIPAEWFETGDAEQLTRLLEVLCSRRVNLHELVNRSVQQLRKSGDAISKVSRTGLLLSVMLLAGIASHLLKVSPSVAEIDVNAYRSESFSTAPQNHPLLIVADAYDLSEHSLTGELVDEYGVRIWRGKAFLNDGKIKADVPPIVWNGVYFFRLYATRPAGREDKLLREYALWVDECKK